MATGSGGEHFKLVLHLEKYEFRQAISTKDTRDELHAIVRWNVITE